MARCRRCNRQRWALALESENPRHSGEFRTDWHTCLSGYWCREELGHALLHGDGATDRALAELEAESVAFIVMSTVGIDSGSYTFGYCASWAGGGEEAVAAIRASGTRIQGAADIIITMLDHDTSSAA